MPVICKHNDAIDGLIHINVQKADQHVHPATASRQSPVHQQTERYFI